MAFKKVQTVLSLWSSVPYSVVPLQWIYEITSKAIKNIRQHGKYDWNNQTDAYANVTSESRPETNDHPYFAKNIKQFS